MGKHIEALANGMGGPSMYLLWLACQRRLPATVSITADTGWENDCLLSTGERTTARVFFDTVIQPLAEAHGIVSYFVRAKDTDGEPLPSLPEYHQQLAQGRRKGAVLLPMYGSKGGRIGQRCTQRYKIASIRQQLRAIGATSARSAQALHLGEVRRMRGANHRVEGGWHTWNDLDGPERMVKWCSHYYPLIDLRMSRQQVDEELERAGIPYVRFSECEGCPNAGPSRWMRRTPESLARSAALERALGGLYLTDQRAPLPVAIERMQARISLWGDDDTAFDCGNGYCGL